MKKIGRRKFITASATALSTFMYVPRHVLEDQGIQHRVIN